MKTFKTSSRHHNTQSISPLRPVSAPEKRPVRLDLFEIVNDWRPLVSQLLTQYHETESGCWEWGGQLTHSRNNTHRYGVLYIGGEKFRAHRVSFIFHRNIDPGALSVCHECDNPSCINPDHLFSGTPLENSRDMVKKGRVKQQNQSCAANHAAKLTEPDIDVVVSLLPMLNNKQIAARLDHKITHSMVSRIRLGKAWSEYTKIV